MRPERRPENTPPLVTVIMFSYLGNNRRGLIVSYLGNCGAFYCFLFRKLTVSYVGNYKMFW